MSLIYFYYRRSKRLPPPSVLQLFRHGVLREPHGEPRHDHPQDGHLVQQLPEKGQGGVEVGRGGPHDDEEEPNEVDAGPHGRAVLLVEVHEEGGHHEEEQVGHCVEELGDQRGEGVVLLAPVHGGTAAAQLIGEHA